MIFTILGTEVTLYKVVSKKSDGGNEEKRDRRRVVKRRYTYMCTYSFDIFFLLSEKGVEILLIHDLHICLTFSLLVLCIMRGRKKRRSQWKVV